MSQILEQCFQEAVRHHLAGRLADAERNYRQVLAAFPQHFDAQHLLGVIAHQVGQHEQAVELLRRAINLNPGRPEPYNNLGEALRSLGHTNDAEVAYRKALELAPAYADAHNNLGTLLRRQGKHEEASERFRKALQIKPDHAGALNNLGSLLLRMNRATEAIDVLLPAVNQHPRVAQLHYNLGKAFQLLGRRNQAIAALSQALTLDPRLFEGHLTRGNLLADLGQHMAAEQDFARAIALKSDSLDARLGLGYALANQGKTAEALDQIDILIRQRDDAGFPNYAFGVLLARCGRREEARAEFETSLARHPEDRQGAHLALASLGFDELPKRASDAQLVAIYENRAAAWNRSIDDVGGYAAARLIAEAVARHAGNGIRLDILDAGCGTGLVGQRIHQHAKRLDGVDISQAMLDHAQASGHYQQLYLSDLEEFAASHPQAYDVVTSAATLIHFGDLAPVFASMATTLRDGGRFIFTLFPHDGESAEAGVAVGSLDGMAQGGCFLHGRNYVRRIAAANSLAVEALDDIVHEYHNGKPVAGLLVVLQRQPRSGVA